MGCRNRHGWDNGVTDQFVWGQEPGNGKRQVLPFRQQSDQFLAEGEVSGLQPLEGLVDHPSRLFQEDSVLNGLQHYLWRCLVSGRLDPQGDDQELGWFRKIHQASMTAGNLGPHAGNLGIQDVF